MTPFSRLGGLAAGGLSVLPLARARARCQAFGPPGPAPLSLRRAPRRASGRAAALAGADGRVERGEGSAASGAGAAPQPTARASDAPYRSHRLSRRVAARPAAAGARLRAMVARDGGAGERRHAGGAVSRLAGTGAGARSRGDGGSVCAGPHRQRLRGLSEAMSRGWALLSAAWPVPRRYHAARAAVLSAQPRARGARRDERRGAGAALRGLPQAGPALLRRGLRHATPAGRA